MMTMGALLGYDQTTNITATSSARITSFKLSHAEYDRFVAKKDKGADKAFECCGTPANWDFDTIINAGFNGNLISGNITDDLAAADFIRIKRRLHNTYNWITLWEIDPKTDPQGWDFMRYDKTARGNHTYEYAIVPVAGGIEGAYNNCTVDSCFEGIWLFDPKDGESYSTQLEYDNIVTGNKPVSVVETLGHAKAYTVSNGLVNYQSGQVSGIFAPYDTHLQKHLLTDNPLYREKIMRFLTNQNEKLLKMSDGRMWLCAPSSNPQEQAFTLSCANEPAKIVFDWVENADCDSGKELYKNGFIECDNNDDVISYN